jgi:hypothetical protein
MKGCSSILTTTGNTSADCFASSYAPRKTEKGGEAVLSFHPYLFSVSFLPLRHPEYHHFCVTLNSFQGLMFIT